MTPSSGAGVAEAMHLDVDQPAKFAGEVLDVHAGSAIDLGRVLAREEGNSHDGNHNQGRWPATGQRVNCAQNPCWPADSQSRR